MASFGSGFSEGFNRSFALGSRASSRRGERQQQTEQAAQARAATRLGQIVDTLPGITRAMTAALNTGTEGQPIGPQGPPAPGAQPTAGQARRADLTSLAELGNQWQLQATQAFLESGVATDERQAAQMASMAFQASMQEQRNANFQQAQRQDVTRQGAVQDIATLGPLQAAQAGAVSEAQAAGTQRGRGPDAGVFVNFVDPKSGGFQGTVRRDSAEASQLAAQGFVATSAQLSGGQQEIFPGTERQRGTSARAQGRTAGNVAEGINLLQRAEELGPGVAGVRGATGSFFGSLIGQFDNDLADIASEAITDVDQETLQRFRTDAQAVIAAAVEPFTGENSGRVTQRELEIADNAVRVAKAFSSFGQLRGALRSAIALQYTVLDREAREAGGTPVELDTADQQDDFGARLLEIGLPPELIAEIIVKIIRERRVRESVVQ